LKIQRVTDKMAVAACRLPPGQLIKIIVQTDKIYIEGLQKLDKRLLPAFIIQDVFNNQIVFSYRCMKTGENHCLTSENPIARYAP
tara:strand:+ start:632 stop:886 length:255 start_codon:yes stop_codon:yes gene_type:complete